MALKAILLDHDGTLVDSEVVHYQIWRQVLGELAPSFDEQAYKDHCSGVSTENNAAFIINHHGVDLTVAELVQQRWHATESWLVDGRFPLMPGVTELFQWLADAGPVAAIVSGAEQFVVEKTVQNYQWQAQVKAIATGDQVANNKPAPDSYLLALSRLGLEASEAIAVEDTQSGTQAALAAGLRCVVVRNEYSMEHDFTGAEVVFDAMPEALDYLKAQF